MKGWPLYQVDVNNAFLNGELTEEIFMDQPPGFQVPSSNGQKLVCKLNKALYGLRQAPRAWLHTLKQFLVSKLGFHASKADPPLFIQVSSDSQLLLMAYVDDIVITGSSSKDIDSVVLQLHDRFTLKDMGQLNYFLGIEVQSTPQGLFLNQRKYVQEILHKTGMVGAAVTPTPTVSTPKLVASDDSQPFANGHLYRSTVRMLQYMCITRPDLSFCVNKLSQYMSSSSDTHWRAVKRVLPYLIGTMEHGLLFSQGQFKRSTTGYVIYLGSNPIAWCSKKQAVVFRSSSEVEYRSLANCVSELLWVKQLLEEVGISMEHAPVVWCDNTSIVSMSANPTHHARVKHVEIVITLFERKCSMALCKLILFHQLIKLLMCSQNPSLPNSL
ncbi:Retrovirus-related Pol polyprotein from transposon TNT 1-94 [Gossypium australe]|uniref:Retrovirus-related Pol polyprotein from transposon TNT 1-94 n=1 Tax=Gossypium australe TaxID=47621 RepID=A0A5B6W0S3_9ROSI|nr:Retrovirus-related Pol polyprotein from transposon TNT 1-94 [Gossypium australe]